MKIEFGDPTSAEAFQKFVSEAGLSAKLWVEPGVPDEVEGDAAGHLEKEQEDNINMLQELLGWSLVLARRLGFPDVVESKLAELRQSWKLKNR